MIRRLVALALAVGTAAAPLPAQSPSGVTGRVLDAATGAAVPLAEVGVGDLRASSDATGHFRFGSVAPGHWRVRARRVGYAPWEGTVEVVPGLERELLIVLQPIPVRLDTLTAVASPGGIAIEGHELVRRGRDLSRALDGWEGVVVRRTGATGPAAPQVRGGGPDEVLVLVDGFPVNDPLTGRADLSTISTGEVERVTLVPGAQTVREGRRAVAGVLVVETRQIARPELWGFAGSHGSRGVRLAGPLGPLAASASAERAGSDFDYDVPEVRGGGEAVRLNAGGEQYAAMLRLDRPVSLMFRGSASDRGLPGTTTNPTPFAEASDRSALLGVRGGGRLRWHGSLQWIETRARDSAPPTGAAYHAYTHGTGAAGGLEYGVPLRVGRWTGQGSLLAEARGDRFGGDGVRPGASFTHVSLRSTAAFSRGRATIWTVSPALRLDAWTGSSSPRASLRIDAGAQRGRTSATIGVGSGVTPPVLADLLFREGVGVRLNPDLRPERVTWEVEGGLRRELAGGRGAIALRGFYGRVADLVVWAPDFRFIWSPRNFDVVRRGGELTLTVRPDRVLRLDASASYAAVTYDRDDGAQVQYRPRVTYAASASVAPGAWLVDLRWRRIGRRFPNAAGTNPRPSITLLDFAAERRLAEYLVARAEVRDLTDERAEFIAGYPTPGRTFTFALELTLR
ncbi:MAG TPA: TonB-dependent receptor [Gemmatimonadales bacterium]|nr:TonB-dependent receptor [Gemmatimonadales bacterium]